MSIRCDSLPPLPHLEFALTYLIAATGIRAKNAERRLNGLESVLVEVAGPWRQGSPILSARELRMSETTRRQWLEWVDVDETADSMTLARIAQYTSQTLMDESVPSGWIRIQLRDAAVFRLLQDR